VYLIPLPYNCHFTNHLKRIENECLKELASFQIPPNPENPSQYTVRTPKIYLYDDATHTQIQEYLPNGIELKTYALQNFPSPAPHSLRPQCHQLGKSLAQYITGFHQNAEKEAKDFLIWGDKPEPKIYSALKSNKEMQALKHLINYDWLLERVDQFPDILAEARDVFVKVKEEAERELEGNILKLMPIHGDFSTAK